MPNEITELQLNLDSYKALSVKRLAQQKIVDNLKKDEYALRDSVIGYLTEHPQTTHSFSSTLRTLTSGTWLRCLNQQQKLYAYAVRKAKKYQDFK